MGTFLITGGTGRIGTAFTHAMVAKGHTVRLGTRSPQGISARIRQAFGPGLVEPIAMSIDDPESINRAFQGCEGALLVAPFGEMDKWHAVMSQAAKKAQLQHLIKVSVTGARGPDSNPPPGRIPSMHWAGEEHVRASGVPYTMIRPTIFAQHFLGLSPALFSQGDSRIHLPTGSTRVAFLDCRDIGICAAELLSSLTLRTQFAGKAFELTGSTPISAQEIAKLLSQIAGRSIEHIDGVEAFSKHAQMLNVPDLIKGIYIEASEGWFSEVHDQEFQEIVGRHTTSFAKFAYDHRFFFI